MANHWLLVICVIIHYETNYHSENFISYSITVPYTEGRQITLVGACQVQANKVCRLKEDNS